MDADFCVSQQIMIKIKVFICVYQYSSAVSFPGFSCQPGHRMNPTPKTTQETR
jgi:hypothetical protein